MTLYKFLDANLAAYHVKDFYYPAPHFDGTRWIPGKWIAEKDCEESDNACGKGLHLAKKLNPKWYTFTGNCYEAEGIGLLAEDDEKARFRKVRLLRPVSKEEIFKANADLSGAYLSGAYLSDANLSDANLSDAYLSRANLSGAYLSRAYLSRAYLSGAYLSRANLSGAYLSRANLSRANLSGANLSGANLSGANLSDANLSDANLSDANLSDANLSGANLSGAYYSDFTVGMEQLTAEQKSLMTKW